MLTTAIALVTFLFVLLSALSTGVDRTLTNAAMTLITGHLNVNGIFKAGPDQAVPLMSDYESLMTLVRHTVPELDYVVHRGRGGAKLVAEGASLDALLMGVDVAREPALRGSLGMASGRLSDLSQAGTVVVFRKDAEALALAVGDTVTLVTETLRGVSNTADLRVVAIARDVGVLSDGAVLTSMESLRTLYRVRPDVTGMLQLHLRDPSESAAAEIAERLRRALTAAGYQVEQADAQPLAEKLDRASRASWTGQRLDVSTWQDEVAPLMWSFRALRALSTLMMSVLLVITGAGIMNSLWIATRERTREIGALRAIGMQRAAVARLFLFEAGLLGLLGASIGSAIGVAAALSVNALALRVPAAVQLFVMSERIRLVVEPGTLILGILVVSSTTCAAAILPALRAARRRPVEAMGHFG